MSLMPRAVSPEPEPGVPSNPGIQSPGIQLELEVDRATYRSLQQRRVTRRGSISAPRAQVTLTPVGVFPPPHPRPRPPPAIAYPYPYRYPSPVSNQNPEDENPAAQYYALAHQQQAQHAALVAQLQVQQAVPTQRREQDAQNAHVHVAAARNPIRLPDIQVEINSDHLPNFDMMLEVDRETGALLHASATAPQVRVTRPPAPRPTLTPPHPLPPIIHPRPYPVYTPHYAPNVLMMVPLTLTPVHAPALTNTYPYHPMHSPVHVNPAAQRYANAIHHTAAVHHQAQHAAAVAQHAQAQQTAAVHHQAQHAAAVAQHAQAQQIGDPSAPHYSYAAALHHTCVANHQAQHLHAAAVAHQARVMLMQQEQAARHQTQQVQVTAQYAQALHQQSQQVAVAMAHQRVQQVASMAQHAQEAQPDEAAFRNSSPAGLMK